MEMPSDYDVALWEAINEYTAACGGDTGAGRNAEHRMRAVPKVSKAVARLIAATPGVRLFSGDRPNTNRDAATTRATIARHVEVARVLMEEARREPETPTCHRCAAGDFPFDDGGDWKHFLPGDDREDRATLCPISAAWVDMGIGE